MEEKNRAEDTPLTRLVGRYVNNMIDYEMFENAVKELYSDKKDSKPTLKEFDLEKAKAGKPVCTRDGRKARIICFDRVFYHEGYNYPIVAMIKDDDNELVCTYTKDGLLTGNEEHDYDLMMIPEKKEGWAVIKRSSIYETEEQAKEVLLNSRVGAMVRKIEWEE